MCARVSTRPVHPPRTHARAHTRRGELVCLCHACCGSGPLTSDVKDRMYVLVREEASLVASSPVCPFFSAAMEWVSSTQFSIVTPWRYWFVCPLSPIPVPHPRDHRDISPSSPIRFDPSLGCPPFPPAPHTNAAPEAVRTRTLRAGRTVRHGALARGARVAERGPLSLPPLSSPSPSPWKSTCSFFWTPTSTSSPSLPQISPNTFKTPCTRI